MLIDPVKGKQIPGLQVPGDLYWVLTSPAPLAGMRLPRSSWPWSDIAKAGFSKIVRLHSASYDPAPLSLLVGVELEDLVRGGPPEAPDRKLGEISKAVSAAVSALQSSTGVVIHCWGGRGRTGTVLGCILRELGYPAQEAIDFLDSVHKARGKDGWPESEWQSRLITTWPSLP